MSEWSIKRRRLSISKFDPADAKAIWHFPYSGSVEPSSLQSETRRNAKPDAFFSRVIEKSPNLLGCNFFITQKQNRNLVRIAAAVEVAQSVCVRSHFTGMHRMEHNLQE